MTTTPPTSLIELLHSYIASLFTDQPEASASEAYVQNYIEFQLIRANVTPRYFTRIGINYHGDKVQHIKLDEKGLLIGWNPSGDSLGTGRNAKMLLAGFTIFNRDSNEHMMTDSKIGGGDIPTGTYIRVEYKSRGWLGKTKNLDGKQLEKDIDLLKNDYADLLVMFLSETAHRKWRGEGPGHQAIRRIGCQRFLPILIDLDLLLGTEVLQREILYEGQQWTVSTQRVIGSLNSIMPRAEHIVTMCWRRT